MEAVILRLVNTAPGVITILAIENDPDTEFKSVIEIWETTADAAHLFGKVIEAYFPDGVFTFDDEHKDVDFGQAKKLGSKFAKIVASIQSKD